MERAPYRLTNDEVASQLEEVSELLRAQGGDRWRVRAFADAASTVRQMGPSVVDVLDREGVEGLVAIPTIGRGIATAIDQMAHRGRWAMLDRLRGEVSPEELLMTLPGIGETLAQRVHERLGIETLEELELAAHDGRLEGVEGFGPRRARAVREMLAAQLRRTTRRRARRPARGEQGELPGLEDEPAPDPTVDLLLALDREYRERAEDDALPRIAPRRFNPEGEKWLPIWHVTRDGFHFTLLFSNSATAHQLGRTRDWVVVYWDRDGHESQATVVTEHRGPLEGRRVVRGRERECRAYWVSTRRSPTSPSHEARSCAH